MVHVLGYKVKHAGFAVFFWGGVVMILFGWLSSPFFENGAIPAFTAIYGLSFLVFGSVVYLALYMIKRWGKRSLDREGKRTIGE